jgi:sterol desaturase/sphingolipid hydroxylase (fatty acid hydroxylase superfamily)
LKAAVFFVYIALYSCVAPWHLGMRTWWSWALVIVGVDFAYYWQHRFVHRVRVGWAAHQAHHSSEYMNFATALRQKWNPWFDFFFWLPLAALGVAPWAIYFAFGINLVHPMAPLLSPWRTRRCPCVRCRAAAMAPLP